MSDEEEVMQSEEEEEMAAPEPSGPSEAELAMQRRQAAAAYGNLEEDAQELLANNKIERDGMAREIAELRKRSEQRKKERVEEERKMTSKRNEEERQRKAEEEDRRRKKDDEEASRKAKRAEKMAEFEKWKNPQKPNFVIQKKEATGEEGDDDEATDEAKEKVSREQLEAEKRAILAQRIPKLEISGFDTSKLADKAKELHTLMFRLESEKYDLEKRFKSQQYDMMELAERARQMNKVGRGGLKRVTMQQNDDVDKMQEKFAGCPAKVLMVGKFDRQVDFRPYDNRRTIFTGPVYGGPASRIEPQRIIKWSDQGLPMYEEIEGAAGAAEEVQEEEE